MSQTIEIELNKNRIVWLFLMSLGFVGLGFWLVFSPPLFDNALFGNPSVIAAVGGLAIVFFGFTAFLLGRKIPDTTAGLVLNNEGITDNSAGTSIGFIAWQDVTAITSKLIGTQTFILIIVNNPQDYINRQHSVLKKKAYQLNYKTYGTPLTISAVALSIKTPELLKILQDHLSNVEAAEKTNTD